MSSWSLPFEQLCRRFSFDEIELATNKFDDEVIIGRGGFGYVYKGSIDNGAHTVAIKRWNPESKQGASQFWTEIEVVSKLRHNNVISLIGYCDDCNELILVYEYMIHGTMADHLHKFSEKGNSPLPWVQRLKICIDAARGLDYLHFGMGIQHIVIHCDMKSSNILLDKNWIAKISDFGMAETASNQASTHDSTKVKGTKGYVDQNYLMNRIRTRESDIYSFGVVLFEVMCGRSAVDLTLPHEQKFLAKWAQQCIKEGALYQIIDLNLKGQSSSESLLEFAKIADRCLHNCPKERPSTTEIVARLQFALELQEGRHSFVDEWDIFHSSEDSFIGQQEIINASHSQSADILTHTVLARKKIVIELAMSVQKKSLFGESWRVWLQISPNQNKVHSVLSTVLRTIVGIPGVESAAVKGPENHLFEIVGDVDPVKLIMLVRKKQGYARLVSVGRAGKRDDPVQPVLMGNLQQNSLVKLVGFCQEGTQRLPIYDIVTHSSNDHFIFDQIKHPFLDRDRRCKNKGRVARGFLYLHEDSQLQIIQRDLNAGDVMLEAEMIPKVSHFGRARLVELDEMESDANTVVRT